MTPSQIKAAYQANNQGHFFDRDTMRFFGDTMRSFGSRQIDGVIYLYRKPNASVNVFGHWKTCGRTFFNAWRVDSVNGDLHCVFDTAALDAIYIQIPGAF